MVLNMVSGSPVNEQDGTVNDGKKKERIWYSGAYRSPEAIERSRKQKRERYKTEEYKKQKRETAKRRYQTDPEYREHMRLKFKNRYERNKEKYNERREKHRQAHKQETLERQRRYYKDNRDRLLPRIIARRKERDPTIGLHSTILKFKRGELGLGELIGCIDQTLVHIDERVASQQAGLRDQVTGSVSSGDGD